MSQTQASWRLTDSTIHPFYADHSQKPMIPTHFPSFSVPKLARFEVIGTDGLCHKQETCIAFVPE
jgi:hypothetical protein